MCIYIPPYTYIYRYGGSIEIMFYKFFSFPISQNAFICIHPQLKAQMNGKIVIILFGSLSSFLFWLKY